MKTQNHVLLYDDYCPLCIWYTGLFVKYGLLKPESRVAFSTADPAILHAIDLEKGKNEIPLFNPTTGQTLYGIDSLLEILGWKFPAIKKIGNLKPAKWFLKKLYRLISFNRKVVVATTCSRDSFDCSPTFSVRYRVMFMFFCLCFNTAMLIPYHFYVFGKISFYHLSNQQLQYSHFLFLLTNCLLALSLKKRLTIEYLGQVNMLALSGILLLLPVLVINLWFQLPEWFMIIYLFSATAFISIEYFRRMKYVGVFSNHKRLIMANLVSLALFLIYVFH
jgi:hypothetical protein